VRALAEAAAALGSVVNVVNTAGVSPNMAPPDLPRDDRRVTGETDGITG